MSYNNGLQKLASFEKKAFWGGLLAAGKALWGVAKPALTGLATAGKGGAGVKGILGALKPTAKTLWGGGKAFMNTVPNVKPIAGMLGSAGLGYQIGKMRDRRKSQQDMYEQQMQGKV